MTTMGSLLCGARRVGIFLLLLPLATRCAGAQPAAASPGYVAVRRTVADALPAQPVAATVRPHDGSRRPVTTPGAARSDGVRLDGARLAADDARGREAATLAPRPAPRFPGTPRAWAPLALAAFAAAAFRWRTAALRRRARELTGLVEERTAAIRTHERELEAQVAVLLAQHRRLRERFRHGTRGSPASRRSAASSSAVTSVAPPVLLPLERRLRLLVEAALREPGFDPEALAAAAGLSYHQLYRALRGELQVTPSRFIRTVRVECAAELLRQGSGSVTEVAYAVGFESLSYFGRAYRERFGVPPSAHLGAGSDA